MSDAVAKFWRSRELVDRLITFLDGDSILCLATCHGLTKAISQKRVVWTKVVRRTCPDGARPWGRTPAGAFVFPMSPEAFLEANKKKLAPLVELLKMAKNPSEMKLTLMEMISERFPNTVDRVRKWNDEDYPQFVKVRFTPADKEHSVSAEGFLHLDRVESSCRSPPNLVVDSFDSVELEGKMLTALSRVASRQVERIKEIHVWDKGFYGGDIWCDNTQQAKNLLTIAKKSNETNFEAEIKVGDVKKQGWAALGKVAELHGDGDVWTRTFNLVSERGDMLAADRGDLRKIWDAMFGDGEFANSWRVKREPWRPPIHEIFSKSDSNREWRRLIKVLDMSKKQWDEYKGEEEYSESEEEYSEGEEEGREYSSESEESNQG